MASLLLPRRDQSCKLQHRRCQDKATAFRDRDRKRNRRNRGLEWATGLLHRHPWLLRSCRLRLRCCLPRHRASRLARRVIRLQRHFASQPRSSFPASTVVYRSAKEIAGSCCKQRASAAEEATRVQPLQPLQPLQETAWETWMNWHAKTKSHEKSSWKMLLWYSVATHISMEWVAAETERDSRKVRGIHECLHFEARDLMRSYCGLMDSAYCLPQRLHLPLRRSVAP